METDIEIITGVKDKMRQQEFVVCGISEVYGDFEKQDFKAIFNGSNYGKHPIRVLYFDTDMAIK